MRESLLMCLILFIFCCLCSMAVFSANWIASLLFELPFSACLFQKCLRNWLSFLVSPISCYCSLFVSSEAKKQNKAAVIRTVCFLSEYSANMFHILILLWFKHWRALGNLSFSIALVAFVIQQFVIYGQSGRNKITMITSSGRVYAECMSFCFPDNRLDTIYLLQWLILEQCFRYGKAAI